MGDPPNLGRWLWALRVALVLATIGAVVLARRRRDYTSIAIGLSWVSFAHLVRGLLAVFVLGAGPPGGVPYQGIERAFFHVEQALFISWPLGITALAIHVLTKRRAWPVALAYAALVAVLVFGYPTIRRELLQSVYLGVTLAALAVSLGAAVGWWRARTPTTPPQSAVLLCILAELGAVVGPYAAGVIDKSWPVAQGLYFGLYVTLTALEVAWIRRR